jgi:hypothetical protein
MQRDASTRATLGFVARASVARAVLLLAILAQAGCSVRVLAPSEPNPDREQLAALQSEVERLRARNEELTLAIDRTSQSSSVKPEILANAPAAVALAGAFGSALPSEQGGDERRLIVQVLPQDGRGRFVQVTGWADMTIFGFPEGSPSPTVFASRHFEPAEWRDSLRSGLFGIYYALDCPLPSASTGSLRSVFARIQLLDGFTQRSLEVLVECPLEPIPAAPQSDR